MGYHMYHLTYFTYPRCCTETLFNSLRNSIVLRWYVRKNADMFISISGFCPAPPSWLRGASSSRCPQDSRLLFDLQNNFKFKFFIVSTFTRQPNPWHQSAIGCFASGVMVCRKESKIPHMNLNSKPPEIFRIFWNQNVGNSALPADARKMVSNKVFSTFLILTLTPA